MPIILALQSNPDDSVKLGLDREIREINNAIAPAARRDLQIIQLGAVRIKDLPRYLLEYKPAIFHFCGHGTTSGELVFQDDDGNAVPISDKAIQTLFESVGRSIECVVLSACFSDKQAERIAEFVPNVIGNTEPISDDVALDFSIQFYQALSYGKSVREAFAIARDLIAETDESFEKIPKLYSRDSAKSGETVLFRRPVVKACFKLGKDNKPIRTGRCFDMKVWIENLPTTAFSVEYNFNHESVSNKIVELDNDGSGTDTWTRLSGNIQLKVTIWYKQDGDGIVTSMYDALQVYYKGKKNSREIKDALRHINEN